MRIDTMWDSLRDHATAGAVSSSRVIVTDNAGNLLRASIARRSGDCFIPTELLSDSAKTEFATADV